MTHIKLQRFTSGHGNMPTPESLMILFCRGLSIEQRASRWHQILSQNIKDNYVVEDNGKIVGWITYGKSRDKDATEAGEICGIYILPDYWMRGFGRELMEFAEASLWQQEFRIITLGVLELNAKSRNFRILL
ncbi:MAG: GNAT family N-acetyltransferase [Lentisphaerota bacterium]